MWNEYIVIIWVLAFLLFLAVLFSIIVFKTLKDLNTYNDEILEDLRKMNNRYNRENYHFRNLKLKLIDFHDKNSEPYNCKLSKREIFAELKGFLTK